MIKEIIDNKQWDDEISKSEDCTFYQSSNNRGLCEFNGAKTYCIKYQGEESKILAMVAVYPSFISIPFGPIIYGKQDEKELLNFLNIVRRKFRLPVKFCLFNEKIDNYSWIQNNARNVWNFTTALLNVDSDIDTIKARFNQNRRRIIRKALVNLKDSIISMDKNNAELFYKMYSERLYTTHGEVDFTSNELLNMLRNENVNLYMCILNSKPIAGIVTFKFNDTLITRYNCTDTKYLSLNPNTYLDYYLINKGIKDPNLKYYDFSGISEETSNETKLKNIDRYKYSYGPNLIKKYNWYMF